jgi:phosphatidylethanolamine N-methyltransferase
LNARFPLGVKTMIFEYGSPLRVKWTAPAHHSTSDWIGLYMVTDNRSRELTEVPSLDRWAPTTAGVYDAATADTSILVKEQPIPNADQSSPPRVQGEVLFEGDRLWWTQGVFEFRYHHDGGHNVMTLSQPFEIRISRFADEDVEVDSQGMYEKEVESALLPIVRNCLDRHPDIAPNTVDEPFGEHVERDSKYAKRVVYAVHQMFGIELTPAVVPADGNVRKLAWRICNAKRVLVSIASTTWRIATRDRHAANLSDAGTIQHVSIERNEHARHNGSPPGQVRGLP